jgi:hypothetical protein
MDYSDGIGERASPEHGCATYFQMRILDRGFDVGPFPKKKKITP